MAYPTMLCPMSAVANHHEHDWLEPEEDKWYHCPGEEPH